MQAFLKTLKELVDRNIIKVESWHTLCEPHLVSILYHTPFNPINLYVRTIRFYCSLRALSR